ncbi:MAG: hypothetical protein Q4A42_06230 [Tissierellia bacterium]|nr:hypothetical protein [Tissierellia bacterium]
MERITNTMIDDFINSYKRFKENKYKSFIISEEELSNLSVFMDLGYIKYIEGDEAIITTDGSDFLKKYSKEIRKSELIRDLRSLLPFMDPF